MENFEGLDPNYPLSRQEAIDELYAGSKITHEYFTPEEFVELKDGHIIDENGIVLNGPEFWNYRQGPIFDTGWAKWPVEYNK